MSERSRKSVLYQLTDNWFVAFSQTRLPRLPGVILLFGDQQSAFSAILHVVFHQSNLNKNHTPSKSSPAFTLAGCLSCCSFLF